MEVVMVVLVVGGMVVQTVAIPTGTMTVKDIILLAILELGTILQPIPTGMTILGLELKSKFAWRLSFLRSSEQSEFSNFPLSPNSTMTVLTKLKIQRE
jgi:hypothetical protein